MSSGREVRGEEVDDAAWLRALFDLNPDAVYRFDLAGRFTEANAACERLCGYSTAELIGSHFERIIVPEHRRRALRLFVAARSGEPQYFDLTILHRSGRRVDLRGAKLPILVDGRVVAIGGVARDVTAEREAAATLRATHEHYRALFEQSPVGVMLFDEQLRIVDMNERLAQLIGARKDQIAGVPLHALQDARPFVALRAVLEGAPGWYAGPYVSTVTGRHLTISARAAPLRDAEGRVRGGIAIIEDLTEHQQALDAVRERDAMLRTIVDVAPVAIVVLDAAQRVRAWNPAAERIFGWREDEVLGGPLPFIQPEKSGEYDEIMRDEREGRSYAWLELERTRKDGSPVWISLSTAVLRDADGRFAGSVGVIMDVTERKRLEAQLLRAQRLEAVGQLAGGVAHDFNNLLTAILGAADFALEDAPAGSPVREEVSTIRQAALRGASLTRHLLAFTRQQVLAPVVLDLNAVVADAARMLRRVIGEEVAIVTSLGAAVGPVLADAGQLEQVLMNLALNARDAMPEGGTLHVATSEERLAEHRAAALGLAAGEYVTLAVRDTGVGMDDATRARVFEPFFTTKGPGRGTGLGLSMVYGTIQQFGGALHVESAPGRGSTFTAYFPRARRDAAPPADPAPTPRATRDATVLLVEDEADVRAVLRRMLASRGFTVLEAADGNEALRLFDAHADAVRLVVSDVVMPGMRGPDLVRRLRERRPNLSALFVSGYSEGTLPRDALDDRTALVAKPFSADALNAEVDRLLAAAPVEADVGA